MEDFEREDTGIKDSDGRALFVGDRVMFYEMYTKVCCRRHKKRKSNRRLLPVYKVIIPVKKTGTVSINDTKPIIPGPGDEYFYFNPELYRPKGKYMVKCDDGENFRIMPEEYFFFFEPGIEIYGNAQEIFKNLDVYKRITKIIDEEEAILGK